MLTIAPFSDVLFVSVPIWSQGQNTEAFAARVFHFFDENQDSQVNLLQFLVAAAVLIRTDAEVRLKVFYLLHLLSCPVGDGEDSPESPEEATEATEFFVNSSPSSYSLCSEIVGDDNPKVLVPLLLASVNSRWTTLESSLRGTSSPAQVPRESSPKYENGMPRMNQKQFVHLWKTLYDLFGGTENEQQLNLSITSVGTAILKTGELSAEQEECIRKASISQKEELEHSCNTSDSFEHVDRNCDHRTWSITFHQFKAALYTEQVLIDFFDQTDILTSFLEKLRNQRLDRALSVGQS